MSYLSKKSIGQKLSLIIVGLVFSASPLLATEVTTSQVRRQRVERNKVSQPAALTVVDFDLEHDHIENQVLIKFTALTPQAVIDETIDALGATQLDTKSHSHTRIRLDLERLRELRVQRKPRQGSESLNTGSEELSFETILHSLNSLPHVEWVEPDYVAKALAPLSGVNDPYYALQWNFPLIGVDKAWEHAQGDGIVVAIIDTGVAYENKGKYKLATDLANTNFVSGYNFISNNSHPNDDNGHGTHIAGTIAGSTNNNEGVAGIAYKASIMPIKVLDKSGAGAYSDIAEAIRYAADQGADVINLSLGGSAPSNVIQEAIAYAASKNVLIIAASGNAGTGLVMYPAAYDNYVLAVGATGYDKNKASYSNYGSSLDLVAPGGDTSVDQNGDGYSDGILQQTLQQNFWGADTRNFNYYFYQGTSMAAPHVAAVAALVKSVGINNAQEIRQILIDSAEDVNTPGWDIKTGHGLVRADKAVLLAQQNLESGIKNQGGNDEPIENTTLTQQEDQSSSENTPTEEQPISEEPQEPTEENIVEEPAIKELVVSALTYNMWGRVDKAFVFWESALLGIEVNDDGGEEISNTELNVKVFNISDQLVAQGSGLSNTQGELWLDLGKFTKGTYVVLVEAVKDGFKSVIESTSFIFR
jgi:serine protease